MYAPHSSNANKKDSAGLQQRRKRQTDNLNGNDSYVIRQAQTREVRSRSPNNEMPYASALSPAAGMSASGSPAASLASRDRTSEFLSAVRSFQGRQMNMNGGARPHNSSATSQRRLQLARQSGEFMKIARSIGSDIANTYAKLEKLTLLARRKTLFDDRPREIQVR